MAGDSNKTEKKHEAKRHRKYDGQASEIRCFGSGSNVRTRSEDKGALKTAINSAVLMMRISRGFVRATPAWWSSVTRRSEKEYDADAPDHEKQLRAEKLHLSPRLRRDKVPQRRRDVATRAH